LQVVTKENSKRSAKLLQMNYKILVVDDEPINLAIIANVLRNCSESYSVLTAINGQEACEKTLTELPDLILLDWRMPVMSGIEALKYLKTNELTKEIPIIMQSGFTASENLEEALDAGAVDYIRKPVDKTELKARVKSALLLHDSYRKIKRQNVQIQSHLDELHKLSIVAKETDNSVILINPDGEIDWVNEGFCRLYGYTLEEFRTKYGTTIFDISYNNEIENAVEQLIKNKKSVTYAIQCETKYGEKKWIQTTLTPILGDNSQVNKIVAIETDVTRLKKVEEELRQKNKDMSTLTEYLKATNMLHEKQNKEILQKKEAIEKEKEKTDSLLLSILPFEAAMQLKSKGQARPRHYKMASILFTDFIGFTQACANLTPQDIVNTLHSYFAVFDDIIESRFIEKIKTIGDAYMCAGGLPLRNRSNPIDVTLAGLEIQHFMKNLFKFKKFDKIPAWELRLGIHTGEVTAGVVGKKKIAYDIWGDAVNIASRMETNGVGGRVNVSGVTYSYIQEFFECEYRGKIEAKNRGKIDMYFVNRLLPEFAADEDGTKANTKFLQILNSM